MEITSFYPMIPTDNIEATQATYEALGFKVAHVLTDPDDELLGKDKFIIMKNDNGLRVALFESPVNGDVTALPGQTWMNVRDYDGAVALLKERGYTVFTKEYDLKYLKAVGMRGPEGNILDVVYHKREHDED